MCFQSIDYIFVPDTGDKLVGYFKLSIPVTKDMGPNAEILVFYMRDVNKEMVASKVEIKVKSCFKNKVIQDDINFPYL
jgi:hypothetical protein